MSSAITIDGSEFTAFDASILVRHPIDNRRVDFVGHTYSWTYIHIHICILEVIQKRLPEIPASVP